MMQKVEVFVWINLHLFKMNWVAKFPGNNITGVWFCLNYYHRIHREDEKHQFQDDVNDIPSYKSY